MCHVAAKLIISLCLYMLKSLASLVTTNQIKCNKNAQ